MPITTSIKDSFEKVEKFYHKHEINLPMDGDDRLTLKMSAVKDSEMIFVYLNFTLWADNWWFLRRGNLKIKIEEEVYVINEPVVADSDVGTEKELLTQTTSVKVSENVIYAINKELLLELCNAQTASIRLYGSKGYRDYDLKPSNLDYFRAFYNEVLDSNAFIEESKSYYTKSRNRGVMMTVWNVLKVIIAIPVALINEASKSR
ncbi:MAG: hypothetical protein EA392_11225 [Cryomorphaceae bacterium]|nr:MAG: hypothetical protein EA392_11225 [Cryomorphaceae bacterium]